MNSAEPASSWSRWTVVVSWAVAFAWVEAAVVFYLRTMLDRVEPHQAYPLPWMEGLAGVEIIREAATLVMLAAVGIIAGCNRVSRLGYAMIAFGVWDVFYYLFLKCMCGWPHSLVDWDILFLIPLPWWGPVIAPILISVLMILWGTLVTQIESLTMQESFDWRLLGISGVGILLALCVFMADAIQTAPQGQVALREMLPTHFNWPLFIVALVLMAAPMGPLIRALRRTRDPRACCQAAGSD